MGSDATLWGRKGPPPTPDVSKIPTTPLQQTALFIIFFFPAVAFIICGFRAYIRISMRTLGIDDALIALALICSALLTLALYMYTKVNYYGWEDKDVPEYDADPAIWWNFLNQMFYNPVLALVKASILVFLLRLGVQKRSIFWSIWGLMGVNLAHAVAVFFTALFQCLPMDAMWSLEVASDPNTKCINPCFHIIASSITILTDCLVLILPFTIFLGLQMPTTTKIAVIGIFLIGVVVTIIGTIRLVAVYRALYVLTGPPQDRPHMDITHVYAGVEVNLAIICASIPALGPLIRRCFPGVFSKHSRPSGSHPPQTPGTSGMSLGRKHTPKSQNRDKYPGIQLRELRGSRFRDPRSEIRDESPTGSEEEIMTYNGIMRSTKTHDISSRRSDREGTEATSSNSIV